MSKRYIIKEDIDEECYRILDTHTLVGGYEDPDIEWVAAVFEREHADAICNLLEEQHTARLRGSSKCPSTTVAYEFQVSREEGKWSLGFAFQGSDKEIAQAHFYKVIERLQGVTCRLVEVTTTYETLLLTPPSTPHEEEEKA